MPEAFWESPLWWVLLSGALGCGCGIITFIALYAERRSRRKFQPWCLELEELAHAVVRYDALAVEAKVLLFEKIGQLPPDFDPTIFLTCRIGDAIQRAVFLKAEQEGYVQPGTLERVFGVPAVKASPSALPLYMRPPDGAGATEPEPVPWLEPPPPASAPARSPLMVVGAHMMVSNDRTR